MNPIELQPIPRVVDEDEVSSMLGCFANDASTTRRNKQDAKIKADPELIRLNRIAESLIKKEREIWKHALDGSSSGPSLTNFFVASRVKVEAQTSDNQWTMRAYRYFVSNKFSKAWNNRRYDEILSDVAYEAGFGAACWKYGPAVKTSFLNGMEKIIQWATKNPAFQKCARHSSLLFLIFVAMFLTHPRAKNTNWSSLGPDGYVILVKTFVFYYTNVWISIPLFDFLDDFSQQYNDLQAVDYNDGSIFWASFRGAIRSNWITSLFVPVKQHRPIPTDDIYPNHFAHEYFTDNYGDLSILEDPVLLHGFQTERQTAQKLLDFGMHHPITHNRILSSHIVEPPQEYLRIREMYMARRAFLIKKVANAEMSNNQQH